MRLSKSVIEFDGAWDAALRTLGTTSRVGTTLKSASDA
jgi:hypothetical protein